MIDLVLSKNTVEIMRKLAEEDERLEQESAINLPEAEECLKIIESALHDNLYEPFIMISKRILQAITGLIDISEIQLGTLEEEAELGERFELDSEKIDSLEGSKEEEMDADFAELLRLGRESVEEWQKLY